MSDVLLVTFSEMPDGEPEGHLVVEELAARGLSAAWASWDDLEVDWSAARLVAVRSTWDYELRRKQFLDWAREVEAVTRLVSSAKVVAWNTDKIYLLDLVEAGLPVVPTLAAEDESELPPAIAAFETAVVKPRVRAGGRGVVVFDGQPGGPEGLDESQLDIGPWVVQPLVESVRTEGETSVFVLGGQVVSQVRKLADGRGDPRPRGVRRSHGGRRGDPGGPRPGAADRLGGRRGPGPGSALRAGRPDADARRGPRPERAGGGRARVVPRPGAGQRGGIRRGRGRAASRPHDVRGRRAVSVMTPLLRPKPRRTHEVNSG